MRLIKVFVYQIVANLILYKNKLIYLYELLMNINIHIWTVNGFKKCIETFFPTNFP